MAIRVPGEFHEGRPSRPSPDHRNRQPTRQPPLTQPPPATATPTTATLDPAKASQTQPEPATPPLPAALFGFAGYALEGLGDVDEEVAHLFEGVEDVEVEYGFEVAFTTAFDAA